MILVGVPAITYLVPGGGHATELAQRLVEPGARQISVFGGDGTISEVGSTELKE